MELRVIAATNFGATASFNPVFEGLDFGRPLRELESVSVCLIQLILRGRPFPADSVPVSAGLLRAALTELDWEDAARDAARLGLEDALRAQLDRIECQYVCRCGCSWTDTWWRAEEDPCPACGALCIPRSCGSLRRVQSATMPLDGDKLDLLDLA